jgi:phosphoenolpyruvate carboxykinase (ATP)
MRNMLIRPSREQLEHFEPDYTIYNAGAFPANRYTSGMTSSTSVALNFADKEMVILGTEYAGEMKKASCLMLFPKTVLTSIPGYLHSAVLRDAC